MSHLKNISLARMLLLSLLALFGSLSLFQINRGEILLDQETLLFTKKMIAAESFESVGVFDVNGNGIPDIVSGSFWYEGPDYWNRYYIGDIARSGEYWDDFATIPIDINGNGRTDFVTGAWDSGTLRWRENPGDFSRWQEHVIDSTGPIETIRAWDIDNDGNLEIVPNNPANPLRFYKIDRDNNGIPTGTFSKVVIAETQGHGIGFGDVNGNGRGDIITNDGWIEAPEDPLNGEWTLHAEFDLGVFEMNDFDGDRASNPILVVDINRNGKNDLIVGQAHDYGLYWFEQQVDSNGIRNWVKHSIDPDHSQFHTMEWVDLDGDGYGELITGKRFRAHNGRDPGADDPIGLYYYKWNGDAFIKHTIAYGPLGVGKGTGIYFSVADLRGSGRMDIIVAGKDGLYVFFNEGLGHQ